MSVKSQRNSNLWHNGHNLWLICKKAAFLFFLYFLNVNRLCVILQYKFFLPALRFNQSSGKAQYEPVGSTSPSVGTFDKRPNFVRHCVAANLPVAMMTILKCRSEKTEIVDVFYRQRVTWMMKQVSIELNMKKRSI